MLRQIIRRTAWLVAGGTIAGASIALWLSRFVTPLVYGLTPEDPMTLAGAVATLVAVGAVTAWIPAYRAVRIDPARVLREH